MPRLLLEYQKAKFKDNVHFKVPESDFQKFSPLLLGLGDVSKQGQYHHALAAIFDLEGFTDFTNQIEPHLVVPDFLGAFLKWLLKEVSEEMEVGREGSDVYLWSSLPIFAKFLGDGVLFLWDTSALSHMGIGNIVISMDSICTKYVSQFLPNVSQRVTKPPIKLRCGIARGQIMSVGDGNDFVGPCINLASRLQHLAPFNLATSRKGIDPEKCFTESYRGEFQLIRTPIRGIGDEELVLVRKSEFEALSNETRLAYIKDLGAS
jgi:hypothetical protein